MFTGKKLKCISAALLVGATCFALTGCGGEKKAPPYASVTYGKDKMTANVYRLEKEAEIPEIVANPMYVVGKSLFAETSGKKIVKIDIDGEKVKKAEVVAENIRGQIATADDEFVFYNVGKTVYWMDANKNIRNFAAPDNLTIMRVRGDKQLMYRTTTQELIRAKFADDKIVDVSKRSSKEYVANNLNSTLQKNFSDGNMLYFLASYKRKIGSSTGNVAKIIAIDTKDNDKLVKTYDAYAEEATKGGKAVSNNPTFAICKDYVVFHDRGNTPRIRILKKSDGKFIDDITHNDLKTDGIRAITAVPGTNNIIIVAADKDKKWNIYRIEL